MTDIYDVSPDVFRRWLTISELVPKGDFSILDIGGNPADEEIKMFFGDNITVVNPQYNTPATSNYGDRSFDFVISIDTFEHVLPDKRMYFLEEAIRLAKYKAIIACPFNEPFVADAEKLIYDITGNLNLKEHIDNGLPDLYDVVKYLEEIDVAYGIYNNDNLISWASTILLQQVTKSNRDLKELKDFKRFLNKIYNISELSTLPYRKIIEILIKVGNKDVELFESKIDVKKDTIPKSVPKSSRQVSIIIPTLKLKFLQECIESIKKNTEEEYEIIVINDGGGDEDFLEYLESSGVKYITLHKNLGFSKANNVGFKLAQYEYVVTINADTVVHSGWLSKMLDTIESDDRIAAVAPTNLRMGTNIIINKGCTFDYPSFNSIQIGLDEEYDPLDDTPTEVTFVGGSCILFKKDILFEVCLFDQSYINGWEDVDICMTLRNIGYKIFHSDGVIEHFGGFVRDLDPEYIEKVVKNKTLFIQKWGGLGCFKVDEGVVVTDSTYQERYTERNKQKLDIIKNAVSFDNKDVLDIGCNNIANKNKASSNVSFTRIDIEDWDFKFTSITLFMSAYHHLINLKGLDKARQILKKISEYTDIMIFETGQTNESGTFSWKDKLPEHICYFDGIKKELKDHTSFTEFEVIGFLPIHDIERVIIKCYR